MTDNPARWDEDDRCAWSEDNLTPHLSVDTRGIKYQDIMTKMSLAAQRVMLNKKYESGSHFPFSSNISESVSWLARSEQCFPSFIFSVKNRERVPGSRREIGEMNHPSQLNTNLPSPLKHWLSAPLITWNSRKTSILLGGEKVIEPLTSCCWCESKTLLWICQVCVNIPHFVLHQNFFLSAPTWSLAAAYIIIPLCSVHHQPGRGGWGKMSRGHIFSPRFFQQLWNACNVRKSLMSKPPRSSSIWICNVDDLKSEV